MNREHNSRVCVLGGGLAGLSAAYDLGRAGVEVTVVEAAENLGGLASSITVNGTPIERFYHFICRGDSELMSLVDELELTAKLHWRQSRTSFFLDGRLYSFVSPFDLLRFTPIPLSQRVRFGLNVIRSRYRRDWRMLDKLPATDWLTSQI
ncbi:MAG: FAD-dependent oxidoreductase, partial [bacterium]|nr:FAD-dependent oxidoreductase [bacterium]